jgi:hypothetical protein
VNPISIYSGLVPDATYDFNLGYIDVPVLAQYKLTPKVFASAGPQISFLTRARQIAETTLPTGQEVSVNEDISDNFNALYFSVPLELGYSLHNARDGKGLNLKLRYNVGVSNMFSNTDYGSSRGSTFQVFLSLPFVLPPDKE